MDLTNLKAAFKALIAARAVAEADPNSDGEDYDWLISSLANIAQRQMAIASMMESMRGILVRGISEAGARLSTSTKAEINSAIAALTALLGDATPDESQAESIRDAVAGIMLESGLLREAAASMTKCPDCGASMPAADLPAHKAKMHTSESVADWPDDGTEPTEEDMALVVTDLASLTAEDEAYGTWDLSAEAVLDAAKRNALAKSTFADPANRRFPLPDKAHADNAAARLAQLVKAGKISTAAASRIRARITAAQKRFGESTHTATEGNHTDGIILPGMARFHEAVTILREAKDSGGDAFDVVVVRAGMSKNRVMYRADVLERSIGLLEGRPMYIDHPAEGATSRSIRDKVGWYSNVRYDSAYAEADSIGASPRGAIIATLNLYRNSGSPWFREMVKEALDRGRPQDVGISILAAGSANFKRDNLGVYKEIGEIKVYGSADAVAEPGAGGRPLALVASTREDREVDILQKAKTLREILTGAPELSMAQIREARPEFFTEKDGTWEPNFDLVVGETKPIVPAPIVPVVTPVAESADIVALRETVTTQAAQMDTILRANAVTLANTLLRESHLPAGLHAQIRTKVEKAPTVMQEQAIRDEIAEYEAILAAAQPTSSGDGTDAGGRVYPMQNFLVPYGAIKEGFSAVDLMSEALYEWFGGTPDEKFKGKFGKIRQLQEAYITITGDRQFDGYYHPENSIMREALPTSAALIASPTSGGVTFAGLFGTSMNRRLTEMYRAQPSWWEPIVSKGDLNNMKQQDRVITHTFGSLTERTIDGAEYTELTWGETVETYTPTEYGNLITVGRRAMINDDLQAIQRAPQNLARSARLTLNEYVSALFTTGAGLGPTLADGYRVFDATNHQSNKGTAAFSRQAVLDLRTAIMKTTDQSSKRMDLLPRFLLVPDDLEVAAWELVNTLLVPESNNNARNLLADQGRGIRQVIVVPNWTDTNNYYLMADPKDNANGNACIEMGFLFGREDPELLSQQDPTSGMVWTNDVLSWKVRQDYGGDWIDYRGAAASIVA